MQLNGRAVRRRGPYVLVISCGVDMCPSCRCDRTDADSSSRRRSDEAARENQLTCVVCAIGQAEPQVFAVVDGFVEKLGDMVVVEAVDNAAAGAGAGD